MPKKIKSRLLTRPVHSRQHNNPPHKVYCMRALQELTYLLLLLFKQILIRSLLLMRECREYRIPRSTSRRTTGEGPDKGQGILL